jgi:hypothetical protein
MTMLADGSIVLSGQVGMTGYQDDPRWAIVKLTKDGQFDLSFGSLGRVRLNFGLQDRQEFPNRIAGDSKSRLIITGDTIQSSVFKSYTVRLLPNGKIDKTFGDQGVLDLNPNNNSEGLDVKVLPDDSFLLLNWVRDSNDYFQILSFDESGKPNKSFGNSGRISVLADWGSKYGFARFAISELGNIFVVSHNLVDPNNELYGVSVYGFKPDGSVKTDFGKNGRRDIKLNTYIEATDIKSKNGFLFLLGDTGEAIDKVQSFVSKFDEKGVFDFSFGNP